MKKKDWLIVLGLVPFVVFIDQMTKIWALLTIHQIQIYGPLGLGLYHNLGVFLGTFSDLPPLLRIVSLSTGGGFLLFLYLALQYMIPGRSLILRIGMSFLISGVLGNILDRIIKGAVVDFLFILFPNGKSSPIFNIADLIQWVGYFMVVYFIIRHAEAIWPTKNERKKMWINPIFQMKYMLVLLGVGLGFSIITGIYSFTYLKISVEELTKNAFQAKIMDNLLSSYLLVFLVICITFLLILCIISSFLSHRMAGPLFAFEKFLEDLLKGIDRPLRLRKSDEFLHLEELAKKTRETFRNKTLLKKETKKPKKSFKKIPKKIS